MSAQLRETLQLVRAIEAGGPPLITTIHPEDEMLLYVLNQPELVPNPLAQYFKGGQLMLAKLREWLGMLDIELADVRQFLDFACGYGRFTRHLVRVIDPSCITVSDIYCKAVDFQCETFGVTGVYSHVSPEAVTFPVRYDIIFVASLFSHLPDHTFGRWLKKLYDALDEGGTLLFSTHGPSCLPEGVAMPDHGIIFHKLSESLTHSAEDYGTTYVTEDYVARVASEQTGQAIALRVERGLYRIQDVYAVRKPPADAAPEHNDLPAATGRTSRR